MAFFRLGLLRLAVVGVAEQLVELGELRFAVLAPSFAETAHFAVGKLVVRVVELDWTKVSGKRGWMLQGTYISRVIFLLLQLLLQLRNRLVTIWRHQCELCDQDEERDSQVAEEELVGGEGET